MEKQQRIREEHTLFSLPSNGENHQPAKPVIRLSTCGSMTIDVLCTDHLSGRYETLAAEKLRGRGVAPALTLLKLLASQPHRYASKDWLMEHLRREEETFTTEARLDDITSLLRGLLCPPGIAEKEKLRRQLVRYSHGGRDSGDGYRLADYPLIWLDSDALAWNVEQAARMERFGDDSLRFWERAYQLASRGTYLPDEPYSDWAEARRNEMEGHLRQSVHALARLYQKRFGEAGDAQTALLLRSYWQQHPTDEDALRPLMELLGKQERYQEAEACFQKVLLVYQEEGGEQRPDPRTQDIREYLSIKRIQRGNESKDIIEVINISHTSLLIVEEPGEKQPSKSMIQCPRGVAARHNIVQPAREKIASISKLPHSSMGALFDVGIQALLLVGQQEHWSADEMNSILDHVRKKYSDMTMEEQKEKAISRRDVLMLLTGMSGALLGLNDAGDTSPFLAEEILSICITAIPACWSLVYAGGIEHIEQILPQYLTHLTGIAQRSSHHRKLAASLASQGYKLANLLDLQREDFITALKHSNDALIYGQLAGDLNLQLAALIEEALTFWYHKRPLQTLKTYQRALQLIPRKGQALGRHHVVSPIIAGRVYVGLAEVHAQLEQEQEALQYMGLAQDTFPDDPENDSHFAYTHYGHYYLYLYQGLMYMKLNQPDQALSAYAHFDVPKYAPRRAEITNREAAALLASGDMNQCYDKVETAVALAVSMDSDLRYSEAQDVYQGMLIKWPHERKVKSLVQVFQR